MVPEIRDPNYSNTLDKVFKNRPKKFVEDSL